MGNNEPFGLHTEITRIKNLERRIRPYRMAIIKVVQSSNNPPTYDILFNEFGDSLITTIGGNTGQYNLDIDPGVFKDLTQVTQETDLTHTSVSTGILSSTFTDVNKTSLAIGFYDFVNITFIDLDGECIVYIKEFYG